MNMQYTSAGVIVLSHEDRRILLVQHPEGHWGFPKGNIEMNETELQCATRELREETGITCNFFLDVAKFKFEENYRFSSIVGAMCEKKVIYFLGVTCNTKVLLNHQLLAYKWVSCAEARALGGFMSKKVLDECEQYLYSDYCMRCDEPLTSNSSKASMFSEKNEMPSKHAFSRLAPLRMLFPSMHIESEPNTVDAYYINNVIGSSYTTNGVYRIDENDIKKSWSIVNLLPVLAYVHGKVILPNKPNGCNIGQRPIDLYLTLMKAAGYHVEEVTGETHISYGEIKGRFAYRLPFPSFTGTSILVYIALVRKGSTVIYNASQEPEIRYLLDVLSELGYRVRYMDRCIYIDSSSACCKEEISVKTPADRSVIVTQLATAIAERTQYSFRSKMPISLDPLVHFFKATNIPFELTDASIHIDASQGKFDRVELVCGHYPNICSDWHPMLATAVLMRGGQVFIKDNVFEDRYRYIAQLAAITSAISWRMDAGSIEAVNCGDHRYNQNGNTYSCLDIRASAATIIALRDASNYCLENITQFFRGYENIGNVIGNKEGNIRYDVIDIKEE